LSANAWLLILLSVIVVAVGSEAARVYLGGTSNPPTPPDASDDAKFAPKFKVGDPAPDFSLKDRDGKPHSLSSLVKQDTLLCFICGCSNCRNAQNYLGKLVKEMGDRAPMVVSVATIEPVAEPAYKRDVKLAQTILYEARPETKPEHPEAPLPAVERIMDVYKGHPCPRIYHLGPDRKVKWISKSPSQYESPAFLNAAMAHELGFRFPGEPGQDVNKPLAPVPTPEPPAPSGAVKPKPAAN